jgi:biopolymer transport protein ExbD
MLGGVLVLLVVFMMYAPSDHGLVFNRHISHHATPMPAALRDDAMRVMLSRDGTMYFGNAKVTSEDLAEQIRQHLESGAQHKVFLIVDQRARFGISPLFWTKCGNLGFRISPCWRNFQ